MYKYFANPDDISDKATMEFGDDNVLYLQGTWQWSGIEEITLFKTLTQIVKTQHKHKKNHTILVDGSKIQALDTTGTYFIDKIIQHLIHNKIEISLKLNESEQDLYDRITNTIRSLKLKLRNHPEINIISSVGQQIILFISAAINFIIFFGQFLVNLINVIKLPHTLYWSEIVRTIKDAGLNGLWVVSLLCFLIGVTLAYEMAPQFITYGANVYIVNFLGISLLKEVTPLLAAIIVAGRTGSSITAEIAVMKTEEEIDAIQTMGISPIKRLVLPKVIGVVIAVPLVTAIADIVSIIGGAIVSNSYLGITYTLFFSRMQNYVSINNYKCGIIKSVFFALAIALIGCFCGFNVKGNAHSIGAQTTKSVVWGIIAILFIDAIFAIIFKTMGI